MVADLKNETLHVRLAGVDAPEVGFSSGRVLRVYGTLPLTFLCNPARAFRESGPTLRRRGARLVRDPLLVALPLPLALPRIP